MIFTQRDTKHLSKVLVVLYKLRRAKHFLWVVLLQSSVCQSGTIVLYANPVIIHEFDVFFVLKNEFDFKKKKNVFFVLKNVASSYFCFCQTDAQCDNIYSLSYFSYF